MTQDQAESIAKEGIALDYEIEIRTDYSGQGMMGRTTFAVVGYASEIEECCNNSEECYQHKFKMDLMGKSHAVVY